MDFFKEESFFISNRGEITLAKRKAKTCALEIGFDEKDAEGIAIVTIELGSNIIKYAQHGIIRLIPLFRENRKGIQI